MAACTPTRPSHNYATPPPTISISKPAFAVAQSRPALGDRMLSSPPLSPNASFQDAEMQNAYQTPVRSNGFLPTPPTSPRQTKSSTDLSQLLLTPTRAQSVSVVEARQKAEDRADSTVTTHEQQQQQPEIPELLECPFDVEVAHTSDGREQIFGRGVWSTVYRAIGRERIMPRTDTYMYPLASSPTTGAAVPLIVAVKMPARRDAKSILLNEAIVLTQIVHTKNAANYVVPFYGYQPITESLVLGPVPLSLHDHIQACADTACHTTSTWPSSDPVIGSTKTWLSLAEHLITALAWLHTSANGGAGAVHGDIKPSNILLAPISSTSTQPSSSGFDTDPGMAFPFTPLFADFSSSQLLSPADASSPATITPNTLSAVTRDYTAPELLHSSVLRNPNSVATTASDVFSLAITLLVAATGVLTVYPCQLSIFQRQAMATQGWDVLNFMRNGGDDTVAARVPRHGIVDRVLERAVLKAGMGRIGSLRWKELVGEVGEAMEPVKL